MPPSPVPQDRKCGVPGCPEPRKIVGLCRCDEGECPRQHMQPECCKRHSASCAGAHLWRPNDGIIDWGAVDIAIHDERIVSLTWVEGLIVSATLSVIGFPLNEITRRLGFDASIHRHGVLRGRLAQEDLQRAVAAIQGLPPPGIPTPEERERESKRRRYAARPEVPTAERLEQKAQKSRERRARVKAEAEEAAKAWEAS